MKFIKSKKGQAMVEFAMILPLFLMMLAGILNFGQIYYARTVTKIAAYEGARNAIVYSSADQATGIGEGKTRALENITNDLGTNNERDASITLIDGAWGKGKKLKCTVTYTQPILFPWIQNDGSLRNEFMVESSQIMRIERD